MLFYYFFLELILDYIVYRHKGEIPAGFFNFASHNFINEVNSGPLWFVLCLLIFAVAYAAFRAVASGRGKERRHLPPPTNMRILTFIVGIGLITFLVRLQFSTNYTFFNLQLGYFALYISMYILGILACRHSWLDSLRPKQVNLWFGICIGLIALMPLIMAGGGALEGNTDVFAGGSSWQAYTYASLEPFLCVGISVKLLLLFRNRFNIESRLSQRMARSAYTAYILHPLLRSMRLIPRRRPALRSADQVYGPLPSVRSALLLCVRHNQTSTPSEEDSVKRIEEKG